MSNPIQKIKESILSKDGTTSHPRFGTRLLALGLLLALAVSAGGWLYFRHEYAVASQTAQETLASIADLKVKTIENWMNERLGDTEVMRDSMMARGVLLNPTSPDARQLAAKRFDVWLKVYGYATVMVADSNGVVQLKEPANYPLPDAEVSAHVLGALQQSPTVQADLRRDAGGKVHLWLSGQVFTQLQTNGPPDGAFISVVDPYRFLYPFIEKWPTPSKSAETLLVRRDGDDAVFLTPLRHATNEPLTLRFPINSASQLPSVKMFRGDKDIAEGQAIESLDYRGVPVLAVTRWIPNTPWLMISKVDKEELFAPLRQEAYEIGIISGLFLTVIILGIGLLWRQQKLISVKMFRGDKDIAEGQAIESLDYRGVPVLAVTRWIPNTPWLMISKVDKEELFAPLRQEAYEIGIISGLFLTVIILGIGLLWRQQKLIYARTGELRLRTLIEQAPLAINISRDGKSIYANQKFLDFYGYQTVEELVGRSILVFWAQEFRETIKERVQRRALGEPVPSDYEGMAQRKDGSRFPVQIVVASVELPDGQASMAFINDITERKQLEHKQVELAAIVDSSDDAIIGKSLTGIITSWNRGAEKIFGYSADEAIGQPLLMLMPADRQHEEVTVLEKISRGEVVEHYETVRIRKDGRQIYISATISPLKDGQGKVIGASKIARDVTEQKLAEEELISKTALLEAQVDSTIDGILVVDEHGKRILQNRRFLELLNVPEEIACDDDDTKLLQHAVNQMKNPAQFKERVAYLYAHPEEIGHEEIELADGRVFDRYSSPVRDKAGKHFGRIWTFRDITPQRKLEEQFRQSQKMEAVGQLASGVAHDFNNILAVIQIQAELLKTDGDLNPVQRGYATEIGESTQRAAALTRQLLLFSRKEQMQPRELDLDKSINDMTKMLRRTLGENISFQFKFSVQPLFVHADAGMLDQVLMNLAVNARDAMPKGGTLVVETAAVELDEQSSAIFPQSRPGAFVCLTVSDTGTGIPPEILPRIFEPFFTTKDVGKGTGLGLATVFGIVQQHNGWINVYSEVGHGTTFRIYLPRLARNSDQKFVAPLIEQAPGGDETILVAEDEPKLRASVISILTRLGYNVIEASDGASAVEAWKKHRAQVLLAKKVWNQDRDDIQLLLTDMVMPGGMTGKDLGEQLLKENPGLKVIYVSGYSAEIASKNFPLQEGVNFLSKPFQAVKLAQTIRKLLDS